MAKKHRFIIENVRCMFPALASPKSFAGQTEEQAKYGVKFIIPKSDKEKIAQIKAAVKEAVNEVDGWSKKVKDQENTIAVINAGEFFGEMALLDGLPRSAAAKAGAATTVLTITRDNYNSLRASSPQTALKIVDILVKVLSNRLRQANKNLEVISFWIE